MCRQPKKRVDENDFKPLYLVDKNNNLIPSEKLYFLAARLGIEHIMNT